jgi:hypothetical protein
MDGVIMIFTENELLLMIGVVSVLLLCISVLTILDLKDYLKSKKAVTVLEDEEYLEEKEEPVTVSLIEEEPIVKEDNQEELLMEEVSEEEIKPEINPIIEESEEVFIPQEEVKEATVEIEKETVKKDKKILDAFEELEEIENNLPNEKDDITNFEAEQERTAIISLDELMKRSNELYNDNEVVQYDDGNEPISIDEVIKMFKRDTDEVKDAVTEVKEVPKVFQEVVEAREPYSKKETIPFISSVYGIEKENNALEFENTATYEKLDRAKYNDFVSQLQEMNENK